MALFTQKRDTLDLANVAVADRPDVHAAAESEASELAPLEAVNAALTECRREQEKTDEGATSAPRHRDPLRAQLAADREPELLRELTRRRSAYKNAVLHREAVEKAARAECRAARVAGHKVRIMALFDALAAVVPVNDALAGYEAETAALLGRAEAFDSYAWSAEFAGDAFRESVLEFRKRRAVEAGLLS